MDFKALPQDPATMDWESLPEEPVPMDCYETDDSNNKDILSLVGLLQGLSLQEDMEMEDAKDDHSTEDMNIDDNDKMDIDDDDL